MQISRRTFIAGPTLIMLAPKLWAQTGDSIKIEGPAFGAGWQVRLPLGVDTNLIVSKISSVIKSVDAMMSPFKADSEISAFNRNQSTQTQPVSSDIVTTVNEARRIAQFTHGAFDPTLGGIVGRFGFGPITSAPSGAFLNLAVTKDGLQKSDPNQTLDLCGIAKGFALDQIATTLLHLGINDFFVELGGEVFAQGVHPSGRPWIAGVAQPWGGRRSLQRTLIVKNEALATSGDQVNSYLYKGHGYSHIIDPQSQQPTNSTLASVSVFAPRGVTADALSTALYAMGPQVGPDFAQDNLIPAFFLVRDQNQLREIFTHDFSERLIG